MYGIWWGLAWQEIKQRYSRSVIGPFWITLSTGVLVAAMGPLYGVLLGQNVAGYIQHLAVSLIIWSFIWFISEHKVCLLRIWLAHELKQNLGFLSQSSISKAKDLLKKVD